MTANCRRQPDILARTCGHWWCGWRTLILYYVLPSIVVIGLVILLVPVSEWALMMGTAHYSYGP